MVHSGGDKSQNFPVEMSVEKWEDRWPPWKALAAAAGPVSVTPEISQ